MKNRKLYRPAYWVLAAGLLVSALAQLIEKFTSLPDFAKGIFFGVALGIEIAALIKMKRIKAKVLANRTY